MFLAQAMVGHRAVDETGSAVPGFARAPAHAGARRNEGWRTLVVLIVFVAGFVLPIVASIVTGRTAVLVTLAIGAMAGAFAAVFVFTGGIMLGTSNRVLKLKAGVVAIAGGAVSAGVSNGIKQLVDQF
jgi:hypothetical protein